MTYPSNDKEITLGKVLQRAINRIMYQPIRDDGKTDDSSFQRFLLTAAANEEQELVNQLLIYEQAPETDVYCTEEEVNDAHWKPKLDSHFFWLLDRQKLRNEDEYLTLEKAWALDDVSGANKKKWKLHPNFELQEIAVLKEYFHVNADNLPDALRQAAEKTVDKRMEEWYEDFRDCTGRVAVMEMQSYMIPPDDVKLETEEQIEAETKWLRDFLVSGTWFQLLDRCDVNPHHYFAVGDFSLQPYCSESEDALLFLLTHIHEAADNIFDVIWRDAFRKYPDLLGYHQKYSMTEKRTDEPLPLRYYEIGMTCPAIVLPDSDKEISGYAMRRIDHLEEYQPERYLSFLLGDMLIRHAVEIGEKAVERRLAITQYLTDQNHMDDQPYEQWDSISTECARQADHIVNEEIISS